MARNKKKAIKNSAVEAVHERDRVRNHVPLERQQQKIKEQWSFLFSAWEACTVLL